MDEKRAELRRLIRNNTLEIKKLTEQNAAAQAELDVLVGKLHNMWKVEAEDYELDEEAQEVERNRPKRYGGSKRRARRAGRSRRSRK